MRMPNHAYIRWLAATSARWLATCFLCVGLVGCAAEEEAPEETSQQVQQYEEGQVRLTATCSTSEAKVAEPITLRFEAEHPVGYHLIWPPVEGNWGGFAITPEPSEEKRDKNKPIARSSKCYTLRALRSGEQAIPELTLRFIPPGDVDAAEGKAAEIVTRPFDVTIASVLTGEEAPETIYEAQGTPVELPEQHAFPWRPVVAALVALLVLLGGGYWLLRWLRDRPAPVVTIPAHRWALAELERLAASDLIAKGDVHEYYFQLSAILRGYLERRFGIMAPEMTTEEFVDFMRSDHTLSAEHRASLGPFLESCDLVKFARYIPGQAEVEAAFSHAHDFVIDTADYGETESAPAEARQEEAA
ncbi:MAG: hypothetical protein JSU68_06630 [Phycisphaerales bacterium]|nr:MAG: hypothetical protein JSU68_06630 [Phycisphaerales bacterium]